MIGAVLNERYRLDAELGRGGTAIVYRARDTLLERNVAVKVMSADALGTEGCARMMQTAPTLGAVLLFPGSSDRSLYPRNASHRMPSCAAGAS